jgi:hypothetical protein
VRERLRQVAEKLMRRGIDLFGQQADVVAQRDHRVAFDDDESEHVALLFERAMPTTACDVAA